MIRILLALLVVSTLLSGCSTVIEDGFIFQTPEERLRDVGAAQSIDVLDAAVEWQAGYDEGFEAGCMSLIFYTTTKQDRPSYEEALVLCATVFEMAKSDAPADPAVAPMPVEPPPVICTGQCI